jgi:AcrR family transcriptional regulator
MGRIKEAEPAEGEELVQDTAHAVGKQARLEQLSRSAVELFSRFGYEGTSLRDIATHADVPLSMIDRYFGGKLDLFNEVQRNVWKGINRDRDYLVNNPISTTLDGRPTLQAILHALIHPVVDRAVGGANGAPMVRLLRENTSMRVHLGMKRGPKRALLAEDWLNTLKSACPNLSEQKAVWALSFVISTMYCGQLLDGWLDDLMPDDADNSVEKITEMMVDFCNAGIVALAGGPARS